MAHDVFVRFIVSADSRHRAHTIVEDLLVARLDPTSMELRPGPHAVIDSWRFWPDEDLRMMFVRGPESRGHTLRFIGATVPGAFGTPRTPSAQIEVRCPLRDSFERDTPDESVVCPTQDA